MWRHLFFESQDIFNLNFGKYAHSSPSWILNISEFQLSSFFVHRKKFTKKLKYFFLENMKHCKFSLNFEQILEQIFEWILSNFLLHSMLEMPKFEAPKVWFQSKSGFSVKSMTHCKFSLKSFWSKFLRWELKVWRETAHAFWPTNENGLWTLKQNGNGVGWWNWMLNLHKSTQSKSFPPFVVYPRTVFARHFFQQNLMRTHN